jgi:hypothetical protein
VSRALIGALLLTVPLLTGCGASAPSSDQLRHQASRICTRTDRQLGRIHTPSLGAGDRVFLLRGVAKLKSELTQLRSLSAHGDAAPVYNLALDALGREIEQLKRTVAALDRNQDPALAYAALQRRLAPLEAQADGAWRALQIPACLTR